MAYFLRQEKKKKGIYLQMYDSYWDKERITASRLFINQHAVVEKIFNFLFRC